MYADVFIVGEADDHSSQVCRIRWSRIGRDECKAVVLDSYSDCEIEVESCRQQVSFLLDCLLVLICFLGTERESVLSYCAFLGRDSSDRNKLLGEHWRRQTAQKQYPYFRDNVKIKSSASINIG